MEDRRPNNFNLIRLSLALLVLVAHSFSLKDGNDLREPAAWLFGTTTCGELAVAGFFVLSGYLITQSWDKTPRILSFLGKRVLRIYPGFIVASFISVIMAGAIAGMPGFFSQLHPLGMAKDALILRVPGSPPVYPGQPFPTVNGSLWTVEYEFRCYVLVLLLGVTGLVRRRGFVLGLWIAVLAIRIWIKISGRHFSDFHGFNVIAGYPDLIVRFGQWFLAGSVCYLYRDAISYSWKYCLPAGAILFAGLFWHVSYEAVIAIAGGYLLFALAFWRSRWLTRLTPVYDISYGVYLYGWPVQKAAIWTWPELSSWELFAVSTAGSCLCGTASWLVVERPFIAAKKFLRAPFRRKPQPAAVQPQSPPV